MQSQKMTSMVANQPDGPGRLRTSLVMIYFIETIVIVKDFSNHDQAPVVLILPGIKPLQTPLEGLGIFTILNPIHVRKRHGVTFRSRFNLRGATGS